MKIHQIRNATLIVTFNGKSFLIDPWLLPKDSMPGFEGCVNADVRQPRVELPLAIETIVDVNAVILTHNHPDHFDDIAIAAISKDKPFFVQNNTDFEFLKAKGFKNVTILDEEGTNFEGIMLYKTSGQHGCREIMLPLCQSMNMPYDIMGVVFTASQEKTLYLAGDTIWCDEVKNVIDKFNPNIIVVNACGASLLNGEIIIMNDVDVKAVATYTPSATIIASHMDTVSHLTVTREDIRNLQLSNVVVPEDNEILLL